MKKLLMLLVGALTVACQNDPFVENDTLTERKVSALSTELPQTVRCGETQVYPFESGFSPGVQIGNASITVKSDSIIMKFTAKGEWFFVYGSAWIGDCEVWPENPAVFPYQQSFDVGDTVHSFTMLIPMLDQPEKGCLNFATKLVTWYDKYGDGPQLAQAEQEFFLQYTKCPDDLQSDSTLSIIVTAKGSPKPVAASAYLLSGADTLNQYTLKAAVNKISLPINLNESHKLVIVRESYEPQTLNLIGIDNQKAKPLRIIMEPAFTILSYTDYFSFNNSFEFYLSGGSNGIVTVNWGDGVANVRELQPAWVGPPFFHLYPGPGNYPITITGDLDNITLFQAGFGNGAIDKIDFTHLSEVNEVSFGLSRSPAVLDFRRNFKLETLILVGLNNLEQVILPRSHNISLISLDGENRMTTPAVDSVIDNLYRNTIRKNIRNGAIGWALSWVQENNSILGPPTATALAQVKIMKDQYGWALYPDPFESVSKIATREDRLKLIEQKKLHAKLF
jgi:hypothetical protein